MLLTVKNVSPSPWLSLRIKYFSPWYQAFVSCYENYENRNIRKYRHCEKYRNFTWFPGVEILRKGTVSAKFRAISGNRPKLRGNCAFPQNFHTRKSGEITVFFVVIVFVIFTNILRYIIHKNIALMDTQLKVSIFLF